IGRPDRTFSFSCTEYDDDFEVFNTNLQDEIKEVQNSIGMRLNTDVGRIDLVRCTTIPWVSFTGLLHPTNDDNTDSVPKISFGKVFEQNG
ncbi:CatA-like O-acetyltransferase, partial [Staphylococcus aureus]|nr:CatA-like O-acetyltransferase [Staphylococcus aureus]